MIRDLVDEFEPVAAGDDAHGEAERPVPEPLHAVRDAAASVDRETGDLGTADGLEAPVDRDALLGPEPDRPGGVGAFDFVLERVAPRRRRALDETQTARLTAAREEQRSDDRERGARRRYAG